MPPLHQDHCFFESLESDNHSLAVCGPETLKGELVTASRPCVSFQSTVEVIGHQEDIPSHVRWYSRFDFLRFREDRDIETDHILSDMNRSEENIAVAGAVTTLCVFEQSYFSGYASRRLIEDLAIFMSKGFPIGLEKSLVMELYSEFLSSRREFVLELAIAAETNGERELMSLRNACKDMTRPSVLFAHCMALALEASNAR